MVGRLFGIVFVYFCTVAAWFIPDTTFSLWSGFWQNAVLNRGGGTRKRAYQLSRERNHRE